MIRGLKRTLALITIFIAMLGITMGWVGLMVTWPTIVIPITLVGLFLFSCWALGD